MLDIKWIRQNPDLFDQGLCKRQMDPCAQKILDLDTQHRACLTELQTLQSQRNGFAKEFAQAKQKGEDTAPIAQASEALKTRMAVLETQADELTNLIKDTLARIPNIPADSTPVGKDENDNVEVRRVGQIPAFDFEPKQHFEIGENLGFMDFERAVKLSGARFVVLYDQLARLDRALASFMIDIHRQEFGYREVYVPLLVNDNTAFGTGQLPKSQDDMFQLNTGHWLIPTAEVSLTNLVAQEILKGSDLPLRFTAYSPCFRAEAGAAGRDTRGMIRQHQFSKVELVSITRPEQSEQEHERMTSAAETILQRLGLSYRAMALCTGDMGFSAQKTYDLEVWLPGQNTYREISSCSNCGDFQARRMNARFRPENSESKPEFVHTLNGSGLAVGRTMIAILENYQQKDGSIRIPKALVPYMGGLEIIQKA